MLPSIPEKVGQPSLGRRVPSMYSVKGVKNLHASPSNDSFNSIGNISQSAIVARDYGITLTKDRPLPEKQQEIVRSSPYSKPLEKYDNRVLGVNLDTRMINQSYLTVDQPTVAISPKYRPKRSGAYQHLKNADVNLDSLDGDAIEFATMEADSEI